MKSYLNSTVMGIVAISRRYLQKVFVNLDGGASQEQARRVLKENLAESALLRQAKREYRRKRGSSQILRKKQIITGKSPLFFLLNKSDVNFLQVQ